MRLKNISIQNFRSITSTEKLELSDYCILLGKNNEGKTNVLKAISFAMAAIRQIRVRGGRARQDLSYSFKRDYPVGLLNNSKSRPTTFILTFDLNEFDKKAFLKETGLHNNGTISVQIVFPKPSSGKDGPEITIKEKKRQRRYILQKSVTSGPVFFV